jgi:colanic acid/amylovoran biosynthesis glycosyltransferase
MKAKLNIAFFVSGFPTTSETFIINQICDLLDRGHEVKIFAFGKIKGTRIHQNVLSYNLLEKTYYRQDIQMSKQEIISSCLKLLFLQNKNISFRRFFKNGKNLLLKKKIINFLWILKHGNFDIVHAHFGPNATYVAEMHRLGFFSKTKLIATFHGYDLAPDQMEENKKNYKNLFKSVDVITVNTPYLFSLLKQVTDRTAKILPVGLNISSFKKIQEERIDTNFNILFVGRLIELKAAPLALEILDELIKRGKKNVFLTFIGEGELEDEILQKVSSLNLKEHVALKGALPQEEVMREMNRADVFLLPGIYDSTGRAETQGLVIQEAQAMELPVVVSDAGGMKYGLLDGETGFVVEAKNTKAFAEKIQLLMENPDLKTRMGKKGREFVLKNYDSKVLGDQLERLYFQLS